MGAVIDCFETTLNSVCVVEKLHAQREDDRDTLRVGMEAQRVALEGSMRTIEVPLQRVPAAVIVEAVVKIWVRPRQTRH
jgi:hypothetical protein